MTPLLRLTSATQGRPPAVVEFEAHEMPEARRFAARLAELDLVRSGARTVEIVDTAPAGGAR